MGGFFEELVSHPSLQLTEQSAQTQSKLRANKCQMSQKIEGWTEERGEKKERGRKHQSLKKCKVMQDLSSIKCFLSAAQHSAIKV